MFLGNGNATPGSAEDRKVDTAGMRGDKTARFLGPLHAGDGLSIIHEIFEADIFQLFKGIQTVTIEVIERDFGFVEMHQNEGRALDLLWKLQPQTFRQALNESRLPASKLSFKAKNGSGPKILGKLFREFDRLLRR